MILFDTVYRLGEFLKGLFDNLTKTNLCSTRTVLETYILIFDNLTKSLFRSMRIFLRTKILIYDNLS